MINLLQIRRQSCPHTQIGVSLIELLISIAISMFLLAGLVTIFSSTNQSFKVQSDLTKLQDTQRMTMNMLSTLIQAAGYFPNPMTQTAITALPVDTAYGFSTAGQAISGTNPGGSLDTITVRYLASGFIPAAAAIPASGSIPGSPAVSASFDFLMDCNGRSNTATNELYIVNKFAVNASKQLTCSVNGGANLALTEGISGLTVLYGVDPDNNGSINQYLSGSSMTTALWPTVISAKVTVIFTNPLAGQAGQQATIPFTRVISLMNKS